MTTATVELCSGSVLFTDLVGFTEYNDVAGDANALRVLEQQTAIANSVITRVPDARIVKEIGDGLMIWFASAGDGLGGASAMLEAIGAARIDDGFPLAMRMGLHYGDVLPRGDDLIGQTVNIAARVSDLAGPGELLVSASVLLACPEPTPKALRPIGPVTVKGVHDPIWLHRLSLR